MMGVDSRFDDRPFELSRTIPPRSPTTLEEKMMLIGDDPHVLEVVAILPLAGGLLHLLVGYVIARQLVAEHEAQAVVRGEVALVAGGEISRGSVVGVVLRNGRTQIAAGHRAVGADAEQVLAREILQHGVGAGRVEAASRQDELPVETFPAVSAQCSLRQRRPSSFRTQPGCRRYKCSSTRTSSASISGPKPGERLSVSGIPSTTNWVWYSDPRGCRTALPS